MRLRHVWPHHRAESRSSVFAIKAPTSPPKAASQTRYQGKAGKTMFADVFGRPVDSANTVAGPGLAAVQVTISLQDEFAAMGTICFENWPAAESTMLTASAETVSTPESSRMQT